LAIRHITDLTRVQQKTAAAIIKRRLATYMRDAHHGPAITLDALLTVGKEYPGRHEIMVPAAGNRWSMRWVSSGSAAGRLRSSKGLETVQ